MNLGKATQRTLARKRKDRIFTQLCFAATAIGVLLLVVLLWKIVTDGIGHLNWNFIVSMPSYFAKRAGILSALVGSFYIVVLTALISAPVGVLAAIYLEEYTSRKSRIGQFIDINIANLSGVPSIVYGLLGLAVFVRWLALDRSILSGSLTMSLLVLPMVIIAAREAIRAVPDSIRQGSLALGATKWQTIRRQVLPSAAPGILTGVILSLSRAIGETAPLIVVGAVGYTTGLPKNLRDSFMVMPLQIYGWTSRPETAFHEIAATAIIVLMALLLVLNSAAIILRQRSQKRR